MEREPRIALTFDVEEHYRIEAAAHLECPPDLRVVYGQRMDGTTRWLLDALARRQAKATFFVVGQIAQTHPSLIRRMVDEGHEVAGHSWDHRPIYKFTPESFREDLRIGKDALEQASGAPVVGFRAPTFSVIRETAWALDALAEAGLRYDSSIFPVRHDRYGVPAAPRIPFLARGVDREMLELPPLTLRMLGQNLPVAGGGYFRLFPTWLMTRGIGQMTQMDQPAVLYFHPWEFDPDQPKLALAAMSRFRTYVGIKRSQRKLKRVMKRYRFSRCIDLVTELESKSPALPRFALSSA